jgi:anaerobic dimethyl sulfoxide reductase subunit B (iron-sulfur subunit)
MRARGGGPGVNGQLGFFIDTTKCINCKTCEIACKDYNSGAPGQRIRRVRTFEGGEFPKVFAYNISMSCNHCEDPACAKTCPAKAYTKRDGDGIVIHNPDRCIGCRYCTWVCPYGAPQYDPVSGRVMKCNLCLEELVQGRNPICVNACPTRAIEVAALADISRRAGATIEIRNLPSAVTKPAARYKVRLEAMRQSSDRGQA